MATCLTCDAQLELGTDTIVGELIICPECGTEMEVTNLEPLVLEEAPQVEEDWGE